MGEPIRERNQEEGRRQVEIERDTTSQREAIKIPAEFVNRSSAASGVTKLIFKTPYEAVGKWAPCLGQISQNLEMFIRIDRDRPVEKIGLVRIDSMNINKDGTLKLVLLGDTNELDTAIGSVSAMVGKNVYVVLREVD